MKKMNSRLLENAAKLIESIAERDGGEALSTFRHDLVTAHYYIRETDDNIGAMEKDYAMLERRCGDLEAKQEVLAWLESGKYRKIMHRHDGMFRLADESLNIFADADSLPAFVASEHWQNFKGCDTRAP